LVSKRIPQRHRELKREEFNKLTGTIIGIAIEVHKELGPGFDEKIYSNALKEEFNRNRISYDKEKVIEVKYKGTKIGKKRIDFLVDNNIILELKAIDVIGDVHLAQMLSYLKAMDKRLGLILNFAQAKLEIKRVANNFF
jgi:GxxExxY protein